MSTTAVRPARYKVPQHPRPWTPTEDDLLRVLWATGATGSEIAVHFTGRSRCSVLARVGRLGLSAQPSTWRPPEPCGCRWIEGRPWEGPWRWCDEPTQAGRPYCARHEARVWRKPHEEARDFEPPKLSTFSLRSGISKTYIGEV